MYYDTDSIIYSGKEGQPFVPTGIFLGQMTDELEGDTIVEFGSAGPETYSNKTEGGKSECKNKGTKSSYASNQVLNCDSMLHHIKQELNDPLRMRRAMAIEIKDHFVNSGINRFSQSVWCKLG